MFDKNLYMMCDGPGNGYYFKTNLELHEGDEFVYDGERYEISRWPGTTELVGIHSKSQEEIEQFKVTFDESLIAEVESAYV